MAPEPGTGQPPAVAFGSATGRWVLAATVIGSGMAFLDSTVVNVALPTIGEDLGAEVADLQWILNGYLLTLSALILLGGSLGDRFGRRRVFQLGVVWFAVASAASAAAVNVPMLVLARVGQGMGGALLTPGSLAILEATFRHDDRPRAIGAWSGLSGVAAAAGPLIGGSLVEAASWRFIFLLNVPLAAVVVAVAARHVPESRDPSAVGQLDVAGALLTVTGLGGLTYALIQAGEGGVSAAVAAGAGAGVVALGAFVAVERRSSHAMLPTDIFSSGQFTAANLVTAFVYAALGAVFFLLVVNLQQVLGYSAVEAGLAALPITVLMLVLSPRSGALAQRIGPRLQMTTGPWVMAAGLLLMARIGDGDHYLTTVLPGVAVLGLGLAATVAPLTATVLAAASERHAGVASGVNTTVARAAQLAAIAAVPLAAGITGQTWEEPPALAAGFRTAMLITAGLAAAGGAVALATIRNPLAEGGAPEPPEPQRRYCAIDGPPMQRFPSSAADVGDQA